MEGLKKIRVLVLHNLIIIQQLIIRVHIVNVTLTRPPTNYSSSLSFVVLIIFIATNTTDNSMLKENNYS